MFIYHFSQRSEHIHRPIGMQVIMLRLTFYGSEIIQYTYLFAGKPHIVP